MSDLRLVTPRLYVSLKYSENKFKYLLYYVDNKQFIL